MSKAQIGDFVQVPGYVGICRQCFCPIATGEDVRLREGGLLFHRKCVDEHPHGYYVKLERRRAERAKRKLTPIELAPPSDEAAT